MDLGHTEKSTALHFAARNASLRACSSESNLCESNVAPQGKVRIVRWLLDHGAIESLHLKNSMGSTPMDLGVFHLHRCLSRVRVFCVRQRFSRSTHLRTSPRR